MLAYYENYENFTLQTFGATYTYKARLCTKDNLILIKYTGLDILVIYADTWTDTFTDTCIFY